MLQGPNYMASLPSTALALPASFSFRRERISILSFGGILFSLCYVLFFLGLAFRELSSSHEARAGQDAQSILEDRRWDMPRLFDGKVEMQKPPLYYWLVAGIARLRGQPVDALAVRLPAAAAALGGVLLLFGLGIRRGRVLAGFIAGAMLATAIHYAWLARTGRIDMPLTFTTGLTLVSFYLGYHVHAESEGRGAWRWLLVAYISAALSVLLKGPIGFLLPGTVIVCFLLFERQLPRPWHFRECGRLAKSLGLWWGIPIFVGIALPWFLWANSQTGGKWFDVFFLKHNWERGFGGGTLAAHPWWFYVPRVAVDLLPWSILLPVALWLAWRRGWWREDAEGRFGLIWMVAVTALLSCSRFKRADYLLPAFPGAMLFLGSMAERWYRSMDRKKWILIGFNAIIACFVVGWWLFLSQSAPAREKKHESRRLAEEIRRLAPAPSLILFFRAESHTLAFHVGRPIDTILEWENLDVWAGLPHTFYVVMPASYARDWTGRLKNGSLEEVMVSTVLAGAYHDDPLVLLRTRPGVRSK